MCRHRRRRCRVDLVPENHRRGEHRWRGLSVGEDQQDSPVLELTRRRRLWMPSRPVSRLRLRGGKRSDALRNSSRTSKVQRGANLSRRSTGCDWHLPGPTRDCSHGARRRGCDIGRFSDRGSRSQDMQRDRVHLHQRVMWALTESQHILHSAVAGAQSALVKLRVWRSNEILLTRSWGDLF